MAGSVLLVASPVPPVLVEQIWELQVELTMGILVEILKKVDQVVVVEIQMPVHQVEVVKELGEVEKGLVVVVEEMVVEEMAEEEMVVAEKEVGMKEAEILLVVEGKQ